MKLPTDLPTDASADLTAWGAAGGGPAAFNLNEVVEQALELAPLPASVTRLAGMAAQPDCQVEDLAELISFDQVLTLKLLRAANSAASASALQISTVTAAIGRMGFSHLVALAVAGAARPAMQSGIPAYGLPEGALWRHSVAAAVAADAMQSCLRMSIPPEVFTAALLHDIGKLVLGRFMSPEISGHIRRCREADSLRGIESESSVLGMHHGELGGIIARHWNLPPRVVLGITFHHDPEKGQDLICDAAYLANIVAKRIEGGPGDPGPASPIEPGVAARLSLSPELFDAICLAAARRFDEVRRRYDSA
jgi:putative nucleotidyltransferase with HDIG domain